jgi:uncharacterized repeat protein (TIGR03806 family)
LSPFARHWHVERQGTKGGAPVDFKGQVDFTDFKLRQHAYKENKPKGAAVTKHNSIRNFAFIFGAPLLLVAVFAPRQNNEQMLLTVPAETKASSCHEGTDANRSQDTGGVGIEHVFPKLRFNRPVQVTHNGVFPDRLYVVEQDGVIRAFHMSEHAEADLEKQSEVQKNASSWVFMDISDRISRQGNEEGLIGFAFHPDFKNNGEVFAHYSSKVKDMHGIVSRFRVDLSGDRPIVDPGSEEIILQLQQPYRNHNGGSIEFGPDGFLYITFGDGGSADDPHGNGQNLETWLGTILRIDVDKQDPGKAYAVPADNPFVDHPKAQPEIWAFGLRNVWRFSFDKKTGELWAGDVGQNKFEEIDIIKKGGNYGWNRMEADSLFNDKTQLTTGEHEGPVAIYGRQWGWSVTGGNVYRGKRFPDLAGRYFYGDYVSGNLWQITKNDSGEYKSQLVRRTGRSIASFGYDFDGEVYLCSFDGKIYRIVPSAEPENTFANWPKKLSETGIYESIAKQTLSPNLIPYEVNAAFWSDGAEKSRFLLLPEGAKLGYQPTGAWDVPIGTTIVKNFKGRHGRDKKMLETRLIKRTKEGWEAATYVWDLDGRDAELVPAGKQFELYQPNQEERRWEINSWHAPSSSECSSCHVDASGFVLGINTMQLNLTMKDADKNQIDAWGERGILDLPAEFDAKVAGHFVSPYDADEPVDVRVKVWLDVNCAMCHQPNGPGNANIDLRYVTALEDAGIIGVNPAQGDLNEENAKLVAPGQPENSVLLKRIETLGPGRMPNVASNQVDKAAVKLVREWIAGLQQ